MRVVVGLGNPGARYARTRHNIGFLVAADLAAGSGWVDRWSAQTATLRIAGETVLIVRPQTYMNRSGDAVLALSELEGFALEETLVVFDDFLLDFGRIRLRRSGSDGGHNGLSSIIEGLRTDAVPRLRLGVGPVPDDDSDIDFVLTPFADAEDVEGLVQHGSAAVRCWLQDGMEAAMNRFNGCPALSGGTDRD